MAYDDEEPKARKQAGPKARGKTAAADRAARAYLEEGLGWLRGYPESSRPSEANVPWRFPGKDGHWVTLAVDRELLRTSFYTLRGARRKFPHALERVVGDIAAWSGRMEERLRRIQGLVHRGEPLFTGESPKPHGAPISSAEITWLSWGNLTRLQRMETSRRHWDVALALVSTSLGPATARRLGLEVVLFAEDPAALEPLRDILLHPAAYTVAIEAGPVLEVLRALTSKKLTGADVESRLDAIDQSEGASPLARQVIDLLTEEADPLARQLVLEGYAVEVADGARLAALVLDDPKSLTWDTATVAATFACERSAPPADGAAFPFATLVDGTYRSEVWTAWAALEERDQIGVAQLKKLSRSGALRGELRQAAAAGTPPHELARLARLYASIKKSERSHWPELVAPPTPLTLDDNEWRDLSQWIPKALHGAALEHLGHAPRAALLKALAPEISDPRHLLSEQKALHERLSNAELPAGKRSAMERRLKSLVQRIESPEPIPSGTVTDIEERLCASAIRARFRRWLTSLQTQILTDLPEPARACIDFAKDRQADVVIAHLRALPTETRTLAYRLHSARAAPQPWDLRDDPANIAWRELAAANGLNLVRWFSGEAFDVPPPDEGEPLIFRLEDDPLEVMKMGLWFDTCLSPGDMNFFSTIANAADANKRLFVGRDAKGTAQARCLFAITEQWHVLAFHVYGHERTKWIRRATKSALQSLCSSIGTSPAPRGKVSTIVARKWYDDGPRDVADQLASLDPGGELALRVAAAADAEALDIVSTALGTPITEVALELILGCEVFLTSAARTASFGPVLLSRRLPRWFALRLAQLLARDFQDLATELLNKLCRGKSPARLNLSVHEALALAEAFRKVGQPGQSLLVLRSQQGLYEADEIRHQTALALKDLGRDDAAARVLGASA